MFKKIISVILIVSMISVPVMANQSFTDIDSSHWGYSAVMKLVNDGTVKGYTDGSFRPSNSVTRAEFVKMMGVGTVRKESDYSDVTNAHWGYDYIMTSEFETEDNAFLPDKPITREETLNLLWIRAGRQKGITAPGIIINQGSNKNAIAWAYNYKIMIGDDGISLRLSDNLSRAEAAALIVRARETNFNLGQAGFIDNVSENTMKAVFESYNLFDEETEYNPERTLTNGEMARAALRLSLYEKNLTYSSFVSNETFSHKYAKDVTIIANTVLGKEYATKEFADKNATVDDLVAAFTYGAIKKSVNPVSYGNSDNYYKDLGNVSDFKNVYLTYAYENGIQLRADGKIGAGLSATHKDIAGILIQLDNLIGTQTLYTTKKDADGNYINKNAKLNLNVFSYPANKESYKCIISGVENGVYEKEITGKNPYEQFDFAREYSSLFISDIDVLTKLFKDEYKMDVTFTIYPNLVWENPGVGFRMRVLCTINSVEKDIDVNDVFGGTLVTPVTGNLKAGMNFFVEIYRGYNDLIM